MNIDYIYPFIRLLTAAMFFIASPSVALASRIIEFKGQKYEISSNTVLLDREGIFGCADAMTDPSAAFDRINAIGDSAVLLVAPSVYWLDDPDDPDVRADKESTPFAVRIK